MYLCVFVKILSPWLNIMLIVDKHCSDVCCDEFLVPQIDHNSKQVKEQWHGKFYLQSVWGKLAILNTENIKICGWITKSEVIKCTLFAFSFMSASDLQIIKFLISEGGVATCLRWDGCCRMSFVANFIRFPAVQKLWKSVTIWQRYREFQSGNFMRHRVYT